VGVLNEAVVEQEASAARAQQVVSDMRQRCAMLQRFGAVMRQKTGESQGYNRRIQQLVEQLGYGGANEEAEAAVFPVPAGPPGLLETAQDRKVRETCLEMAQHLMALYLPGREQDCLEAPPTARKPPLLTPSPVKEHARLSLEELAESCNASLHALMNVSRQYTTILDHEVKEVDIERDAQEIRAKYEAEAGKPVKTVYDLLEQRRQVHLDAFVETEGNKVKTHKFLHKELMELMQARHAQDRRRLASLGGTDQAQDEERVRCELIREIQKKEATIAAEHTALELLNTKEKELQHEFATAEVAHEALTKKQHQITQYKHLKGVNEDVMRNLIVENRGMIKRFRAALQRILKLRGNIAEQAAKVPGVAAQLQDGPSTELCAFLRTPLALLLRTPDYRLHCDSTIQRLRQRQSGVKQLLRSLDMPEYVTAPEVVERVADCKVILAQAESEHSSAQQIAAMDSAMLARHEKNHKDIQEALKIIDKKMSQLSGPMDVAVQAVDKMNVQMVEIRKKLADFENQPGQFAVDSFYKVDGKGVGDWLLEWDEVCQRIAPEEA